MAADRKLAAARLWAAHRYPYFATALFAMPVAWVEGIRTVAVDRQWRLYTDPAVVSEWPVDALGWMLVHHLGHVLRDHAGRAEADAVDDNVRWAAAADLEINDDFAAPPTLPHRPLQPEQWGLEAGHLAEAYYAALPPTERCDADCGSGADAQPRPFEVADERGIGRQEAELLRCQVAREMRCFRSGLLPGELPGSWERWAGETLGRPLDWRKTLCANLRRSVRKAAGPVDYSYAGVSRRQQAVKEFILPTLEKPVITVAVVVDTSGSMEPAGLAQAIVEVDALIRRVTGGPIDVIACDAAVQAVRRVADARRVPLLGGGGTNLAAAIEHAASLPARPQVLVVLTDGFSPWPSSPPRSMEVVIGVLGRDDLQPPPVPRWARMVRVGPTV